MEFDLAIYQPVGYGRAIGIDVIEGCPFPEPEFSPMKLDIEPEYLEGTSGRSQRCEVVVGDCRPEWLYAVRVLDDATVLDIELQNLCGINGLHDKTE